jgi:hypothetical protein
MSACGMSVWDVADVCSEGVRGGRRRWEGEVRGGGER